MEMEEYHNGSINPFISLKDRFDDSNEEAYTPRGPYLDFAKSNILSNKVVTLGDKVLKINTNLQTNWLNIQ